VFDCNLTYIWGEWYCFIWTRHLVSHINGKSRTDNNVSVGL